MNGPEQQQNDRPTPTIPPFRQFKVTTGRGEITVFAHSVNPKANRVEFHEYYIDRLQGPTMRIPRVIWNPVDVEEIPLPETSRLAN